MSARKFILLHSVAKSSRCQLILSFTTKTTAPKCFSRNLSSNNIINYNFSFVKPAHCLLPISSSSTASLLSNENNNFRKVSKRNMAGHAKWQNVKHVKQAKDQEKSRLCGKYSYLIRNAVREGGSDPKVNSRLADLLSDAHKHNVPNSSLENALKRGSNSKMKSGTIEILGPGGCFVILEYETDNVSTARGTIKYILRRHGSVIPQGEGRWRAVFEQKGLLKIVGHASNEPLNAEKALDSAIEAGAEDVQLKTDDGDDKAYLEFFCAPDDLHPVKKELEQMLYKIEEAYVAYIPNVMVELSQEDMQTLSNMLSELEDLPDVVRLYENVQ